MKGSKELGARVKEVMTGLSISEKELGKIIFKSMNHTEDILAGERGISMIEAMVLAAASGYTPRWILEGDVCEKFTKNVKSFKPITGIKCNIDLDGTKNGGCEMIKF